MFTQAVLITGGWEALQSAEIYHPNSESPCVLPDLPDSRYCHSQDGSLMCGGTYDGFAYKSCRRWNNDTGAWDLMTESLTQWRWDHTSWTPTDGSVTYLLGGYWPKNTSDVIDNRSGAIKSSFPLKQRLK